MNINISRKSVLFWSLLISMVVSFTLTILLETRFVDEIAITSGILTGIALFFMSIFLLVEAILAICNP